MSFRVPTFPIRCNIYTPTEPTITLRVNVECNLAIGRRVPGDLFAYDPGTLLPPDFSFGFWLLLPAGTDIRSGLAASGADWVEVPAAAANAYRVACVGDAGLGFPNEHRVALIYPVTRPDGSFWPVPFPH